MYQNGRNITFTDRSNSSVNMFLKDINNIIYRLIGNDRSRNPGRFRIALRIKEHITLSEELFRSVHINDGTGIYA